MICDRSLYFDLTNLTVLLFLPASPNNMLYDAICLVLYGNLPVLPHSRVHEICGENRPNRDNVCQPSLVKVLNGYSEFKTKKHFNQLRNFININLTRVLELYANFGFGSPSLTWGF